jgi:hypothetical protein
MVRKFQAIRDKFIETIVSKGIQLTRKPLVPWVNPYGSKKKKARQGQI